MSSRLHQYSKRITSECAQLWASIDKSNQTLLFLIIFPVYKIMQMKNTPGPTGKFCFPMAGCFLSFPEILTLSRTKQMLMIFPLPYPLFYSGIADNIFRLYLAIVPFSSEGVITGIHQRGFVSFSVFCSWENICIPVGIAVNKRTLNTKCHEPAESFCLGFSQTILKP